MLMRQCVAADEVMLEVPKFVHPMEPGACAPEANAGTVHRTRRLAHDAIGFSVELELPCDSDAGQFVLLAPTVLAGCRGYSMRNFAPRARQLVFVVERKPD